jgi:hypothetical protein
MRINPAIAGPDDVIEATEDLRELAGVLNDPKGGAGYPGGE